MRSTIRRVLQPERRQTPTHTPQSAVTDELIKRPRPRQLLARIEQTLDVQLDRFPAVIDRLFERIHRRERPRQIRHDDAERVISVASFNCNCVLHSGLRQPRL
jgi:hypothetical protein